MLSQGNDFEDGQVDVFEGKELGGCNEWFVKDNIVSMMRLTHSGMDAWKAEYVRIYFDNGTYVTCPDGNFIDGDDIHDLPCS
jgi:hypothetical protein